MPDERKPRVYLFYGDDHYGMEQYVAAMVAKLGDPTTAEMNLARFSGPNVNENDLRTATASMPFLAERRLVIWQQPVATADDSRSKKGKEAQERWRERLVKLLEGLPETTALVLLVADERRWDGGPWKLGSYWLMDWARDPARQGSVFIKEFALPSLREMPAWIVERARKEKGPAGEPGVVLPQAAVVLAERLGNDTRLAAGEIVKLLTYVNFRRPVEPEDVGELSPQVEHEGVFDLVDALGGRDRQKALQAFHHLLEEQEWTSLSGMVFRQFRLLLLAREVMDEGGGPAAVLEALRGEPFRVSSKFLADKLYGQARAFTLPELEAIYRRLSAMDAAIKTGQADPTLAFDTLVAELIR